MKLTVGFSLPMGADEVYLDWEKTSEDSQSEIFLAEAKKANIDGFLAALHAADLKVVAANFYPMSLSRVVDCRAGETILAVKPKNREPASRSSKTAPFVLAVLFLIIAKSRKIWPKKRGESLIFTNPTLPISARAGKGEVSPGRQSRRR